MHFELTNRQIEILQIIVDEYTKNAQPISSKEIINNYLSDLSSATVRNEMAILEKHGLIEKTHTSSGRIPSLNGYKYYEKFILKPKISNSVKARLMKVFHDRNNSIDTIIDESVAIINNFLGLPSVLLIRNNDDLLKRFDLVQISDYNALIILITSSGEVIKNMITFQKPNQLKDTMTCIKIFNDRLVETKISEINDKLSSIKELIRDAVHEYEFCLQEIINKIFEFNLKPIKNVGGTKYITKQPEFQDVKKLTNILTLLEDSSIWQHIANSNEKTGRTQITFGSEFGSKDVAVASTKIQIGNKTSQLSIVGPTRMNYSEVKGILNFIQEEIEKLGKN